MGPISISGSSSSTLLRATGKKKGLFLVIASLLALFTLASCEQKKGTVSPSGRTVKIGVMGPMNGTKVSLGIGGLEGIKAALAMNPLLGNGDRIKLVVEDDGGTPMGAQRAFLRLVRSGVSAVLMLSSSPCAMKVNSVADGYGVPVIAVLATHPRIAKGTRFVSQLCFDNDFQGKVAALFVRDELLISSVAVFKDSDNPYSTSLADRFAKEFKEADGVVTAVVSLDNSTDLRKVLKEVRRDEPELLYVPIETSEVFSVIELTREMGWHPEFMSGDGLLADVLSNPEFSDEENMLNGVMAVDFYSDTIFPTRFGRKMKRRFKSLYHKRLTSFSALGIEAMVLLEVAMNSCPNPRNKVCVNKRIRHTRNLKGILGFISILPNGKAQRPLVVNRIESGKIKGMVEVY